MLLKIINTLHKQSLMKMNFAKSKFKKEESHQSKYITTEEDEMQEKIKVNPVAGFNIPGQFIGSKNKHEKGASQTIVEGDFDSLGLITNHITPPLRSKAILPKKPKESDEEMPIGKFCTLKLDSKSKLAGTDGVYIELSRVRQERKGAIENKYEVLYMLGKGSYGEVQKISDLETGEIKAVKFISKEKCRAVDKYNDEIEILKKLVINNNQ